MKAIIAEKIAHVQALIDLDPHALDHGHSRPLKRGTQFTGKLGIKDFALIRLLASGGFAPEGKPPDTESIPAVLTVFGLSKSWDPSAPPAVS